MQAVLRPRTEETEQRAEPVLAGAVERLRWGGGHVLVAALGSAWLLLVAGAALGLVHALRTGDAGQVGRLIGATLAQVPAVWVLGALAAALVGAVPRLVAAAWAVLAVCLLLGQVGQLLSLPDWVLDASPFQHVRQRAGAPPDPRRWCCCSPWPRRWPRSAPPASAAATSAEAWAAQSRPASWASSAIWVRLSRSSLVMRARCGSSRSPRTCRARRRSPALVRPRATASDHVRLPLGERREVAARGPARHEPPSAANRAMSRRITAGDRIGSPAATRRTASTIRAGGVSLSRKPLAPARSARSTFSSASKVVSTITSGGSGRRRSAAVALMPVHAGHPDVHQHHVRRVPVSAAATSSPSPASPTTSIPSAPSSIIAQPAADQRVVVDDEDPDRARLTPATAATP